MTANSLPQQTEKRKTDLLLPRDPKPGEYLHANRTAFAFMKKYYRETYQFEIAGELAEMHDIKYKHIQLIARPKPIKDLTGKPIAGADQLTDRLHREHKDIKQQEGNPTEPFNLPTLELTHNKYHYTIYLINSQHQLPITQIALSTHTEFALAILGHELPWAYTIRNARLYDNSRQPVPTKSQAQYFAAINYMWIPEGQRENQGWLAYKMPEASSATLLE